MPTHYGVSGNYLVYWNGVIIGYTDQGWNVEMSLNGEVLRFDDWGETPIDLVHRGAQVYVEAVIKEWTAGLIAALWPWGNPGATAGSFGNVYCPGRMAVAGDIAKTLLMTPACTASPAGQLAADEWTFHKAVVDPDLVSRINFNNMPRLVPLRFITFLSLVGSDERLFTVA